MSNAYQNKEPEAVGKCLSIEELTKYVNGELTEKEKFSFEKHLVECELCTDAIEGFSFLSDPNSLNEVIDRINEEVSDKTGYRPSRLVSIGWKKGLAIAASLIILSGAVFITNGLIQHNGSMAWFDGSKESETISQATKSDENILNSKNNGDEKSQNIEEDGIFKNESDVEENEPASKDLFALSAPKQNIDATPDEGIADAEFYSNAVTEVAEDEASEEIISDFDNETEKPQNNLGFTYVQKENDDQPAGFRESLDLSNNDSEVAATAPNSKGNNKRKDKGYTTAMADEVISSKSRTTSLESVDVSNKNSSRRNKAAISMETAMTKYGETDYKTAASEFEQLLSENPNNRKAIYHLAVSQMNIGKNNKAMTSFDKLIDNRGSYSESSMLLKAQILVKKNKTTDAKKLLQELANGDSKFSDRAFKILQDL